MEKRLMDWAYWLGLLFAALAILLRIAFGFKFLLFLDGTFGGITVETPLKASILLLLVSIAIAHHRTQSGKVA